MSARPAVALVVLACGAMLATGCGSGAKGDSGSTAAKESGKADAVQGVLVVDGRTQGRRDRTPATRQADPPTPRRSAAPRAVDEAWPAPELNADGTIADGEDPFEYSFVPVPAMPIEDDPYTTSAVAGAAMQLRNIDVDRWNAWMEDGVGSPFQQRTDSTAASLVEVTVERCGGAEQVATGSVLDDETVVTTATAVENAARRVRIGPADGYGPRIAAMVRYLDVDDDVAVLKVPGLRAEPLGWHQPASTDPTLAYAYGVAPGGRSGTLRRVPVVTTQREQSITVEQPDAFAKQITDRSVQTVVGAVTSGFQGGVVMATNDERMRGGWGFHGMLRARMGLRSDTAGIVVPSRVVAEDLDAADQLDEWFEIKPGGCPQWHR
jgi:hypothetical protein